MTTQSGITIDGPNKPFTVVDSISRPTPGSKQVLVKSLGVGINVVELMQQQTGLLVNEWPAVIGSDCVGLVVELGPDCTRLKRGDYVYGCAPLGQNKLTPMQETFLAQEDVFLRKSSNISIEEACTIGVGLLTAGLCLLAGTHLKLPNDGVKAQEKDEWIVVLGGSGTVGQFSVQIAVQNGATETFNNRAPIDEQLTEIRKVTGGNFARVIDTTANGYELMVKALETCSTADTKFLTTVDDWSEFNTPSTIKEYRAELGHLCRLDEALGREVTRDIAGWIPAFETYLAAGTLKPVAFQVVDGVGWDKVIEGVEMFQGGKADKKIVVRTQTE
ncbi:hypothetical protein FDECE_4796 [Fusarium decemcellulare]|nr:hypothetical protein FDECE_4796 [Fusarium decemcellulare]